MSTADYKVEIGRVVRERLLTVGGIMKVPSDELDIFVLRDFLTPGECKALMRMIDAGKQPSGLLADDPDPEFRTSESCNMDWGHPVIRAVEAKLSDLMGIAAPHGETIQGQRYAPGQQFKPHHDFFFTSEPYWPAQDRIGGQRTWTAMIFLNVPEGGGQTFFPKAGIRVTPRSANLLTWNNLDADGKPNDFSLHQGMPVTAGVKYVITKWFRERTWG